MRDEHAFATRPIDEMYRWFADEAEPTSPIWGTLCRWIAETPEVCERLDTLPGRRRQPNLFLASIRYLNGPTAPGDEFIAWVGENWDAIEELILSRSTQTNEPGRCAVLAPVLASLPQPIALLEIGPSAGLGLFPDKYRYRYTGDVRQEVTPPTAQPDAPELVCEVTGRPPGDPSLLVVRARAGLDLNPLNPGDPDDVRWLRALVWPGEDARERRLVSALQLAGSNPPRLIKADVTERLHLLLALAPAGTTPVIMHSAALAYLPRAERDDVVQQIRDSGMHWLSFEGPTVVTSVREQLTDDDAWASRPNFVVALDDVPLGRAAAHGSWVSWY
ncbi:DUF2332 domain-containing protein [Nigerium massiliense]|uniref:DUF2332 domain-containing protein n=1 Tax=Nigerium massiliense TaxID=1522317 RepID=UPI000694A33C|nr:DUF2332 domain-containing protein [Nigerium massiliense]